MFTRIDNAHGAALESKTLVAIKIQRRVAKIQKRKIEKKILALRRKHAVLEACNILGVWYEDRPA